MCKYVLCNADNLKHVTEQIQIFGGVLVSSFPKWVSKTWNNRLQVSSCRWFYCNIILVWYFVCIHKSICTFWCNYRKDFQIKNFRKWMGSNDPGMMEICEKIFFVNFQDAINCARTCKLLYNYICYRRDLWPRLLVQVV